MEMDSTIEGRQTNLETVLSELAGQTACGRVSKGDDSGLHKTHVTQKAASDLTPCETQCKTGHKAHRFADLHGLRRCPHLLLINGSVVSCLLPDIPATLHAPFVHFSERRHEGSGQNHVLLSALKGRTHLFLSYGNASQIL